MTGCQNYNVVNYLYTGKQSNGMSFYMMAYGEKFATFDNIRSIETNGNIRSIETQMKLMHMFIPSIVNTVLLTLILLPKDVSRV